MGMDIIVGDTKLDQAKFNGMGPLAEILNLMFQSEEIIKGSKNSLVGWLIKRWPNISGMEMLYLPWFIVQQELQSIRRLEQ